MNGTGAYERTDSVAVAVVEAVANAEGADPLSMEPRLHDVIDTDALERVVGSGSGMRVSFEYSGHAVVVDGDGVVTVDDPVAAGGR